MNTLKAEIDKQLEARKEDEKPKELPLTEVESLKMQVLGLRGQLLESRKREIDVEMLAVMRGIKERLDLPDDQQFAFSKNSVILQ